MESLPPAIRKNSEIAQLNELMVFYTQIAPQDDIVDLNAQIERNPDDLSARQQLVAHHAIQLQFQEALQQLVEIMDIDQSYQDNFAQKAMLKLFNIVGSNNPLVAEFRGNLRRYSH